MSRALVVLISFSLCGCLNAEMFEVHCTQRPSDATWTVVRSFWNLASDAATPEARSQDFEALMEGWKGDEFASDTTEGHVIERSVWVEGEQVHGRVVLRTRALPGEFGPSADSMAIEHGVVDATQIIETNGKIVAGENVVVRWPSYSKEIRIRMKGSESLHAFSQKQRDRIVREGGIKPPK